QNVDGAVVVTGPHQQLAGDDPLLGRLGDALRFVDRVLDRARVCVSAPNGSLRLAARFRRVDGEGVRRRQKAEERCRERPATGAISLGHFDPAPMEMLPDPPAWGADGVDAGAADGGSAGAGPVSPSPRPLRSFSTYRTAGRCSSGVVTPPFSHAIA